MNEVDKNHESTGSLNILLGSHIFFPKHRAGTEVLTLDLAKGLQNRGHRIQILTCEREETLPERSKPWITEDEYDGIPIHRIHYGAGKLRDPITNHLNAPQRISLVRILVSRLKPDVVHFNHLFGFSAQVIPEIRRMGIPVLFTPTDYWAICPKSILYRTYDNRTCDGPGSDSIDCLFCFCPLPKWAGILAARIANSPLRHKIRPLSSLYSLTKRTEFIVGCVNAADKVLPATNFLAEILLRHGVDEQRIRVIPYGVDIGDLPERIPIPKKFTENNPLQLGFIGQFKRFKGLHVMLEALSHLGDKQNLVRMNVYGNPDPKDRYYRRLRAIAGKIGNYAMFKGTFPHDKIGSILRSLHFLIVPSTWYESTPLVLCSALNAGIPVLVSRLGGMTEIVEDGINGFAFPPGNAKELSKIITALLDNPAMIHDVQKKMKSRNRSMSDYVGEVECEYLSALRSGNSAADPID